MMNKKLDENPTIRNFRIAENNGIEYNYREILGSSSKRK
jgi:hypothetical protein